MGEEQTMAKKNISIRNYPWQPTTGRLNVFGLQSREDELLHKVHSHFQNFKWQIAPFNRFSNKRSLRVLGKLRTLVRKMRKDLTELVGDRSYGSYKRHLTKKIRNDLVEVSAELEQVIRDLKAVSDRMKDLQNKYLIAKEEYRELMAYRHPKRKRNLGLTS